MGQTNLFFDPQEKKNRKEHGLKRLFCILYQMHRNKPNFFNILVQHNFSLYAYMEISFCFSGTI